MNDTGAKSILDNSQYADVIAWRRHLHAYPELLYEVHETAGFVEARLSEFGCDKIITGIGKTGVVAVVHGKSTTSGRTIGLRADMDALPIRETTELPYASKNEGVMHACGHDGHTAMLLGACKALAETRDFDGTAVLIFQPAEEGGGGGKAMCDDGLMTQFDIDEVYALHAEPGLPVGQFLTAPGPLGASADGFTITINGKGAHGASPHVSIDPLVVGANIILSLQTIASRNLNPFDNAVVTIGALHSGDAGNVIPQTAEIKGTTRAFDPDVRNMLEKRVREISERVAHVYGATATVGYRRIYPPTVNHTDQTDFAVRVAGSVVGDDNVNDKCKPLMGSEDFAFMLEERPGNFMFIGNGNSSGLHTSDFNFDDTAIPYGIAYWKRLVELAMPIS